MVVVGLQQDVARADARADARRELEAAVEAAVQRVDLLAGRREPVLDHGAHVGRDALGDVLLAEVVRLRVRGEGAADEHLARVRVGVGVGKGNPTLT